MSERLKQLMEEWSYTDRIRALLDDELKSIKKDMKNLGMSRPPHIAGSTTKEIIQRFDKQVDSLRMLFLDAQTHSHNLHDDIETLQIQLAGDRKTPIETLKELSYWPNQKVSDAAKQTLREVSGCKG